MSVAGAKRVAAIAAESAVLAGATSSVWKAPDTGSTVAFRPISPSFATAFSTAAFGPEITLCSGVLWLAMITPPNSAMRSVICSRRPCTAAMPPGTLDCEAEAIACPRTAESVRKSSALSTPAESSAEYSP